MSMPFHTLRASDSYSSTILIAADLKFFGKHVDPHAERESLSTISSCAYHLDGRMMSACNLAPEIVGASEMVFYQIFSSLPSSLCRLHLIQHYTDEKLICFPFRKSSPYVGPRRTLVSIVQGNFIHLIFMAESSMFCISHFDALLHEFVHKPAPFGGQEEQPINLRCRQSMATVDSRLERTAQTVARVEMCGPV